MNKRILSLVLALVMVLGTFAVVSAEDEVKVPEYTSQQHKINWLVDNKIVEGHMVNKDGEKDLDLDGTLTREQATKLIVHIVEKANLAEVLQGVMKPFPDVDTERWSNGVISVARTEKNAKTNQPIVIGFEDGLFRPEKELSYAELATMLVRIVKNDLTNKMVENAVWATSWMRWAEELGILDGVKVANSDAPITRADAFEMIFNTMKIRGKYNKNSVDFKDEIGIVSKLQAGEIEINQEKTYKINANTMATDGTLWHSLGQNVDYRTVGSLVRYIVNEDGVVTHILELGNKVAYKYGVPTEKETVVKNPGWFDKADKTISTEHGRFVVTPNHTDIKIGNSVYEINKGTRFFVADVSNNALKEVKTLDELFSVWGILRTNENLDLYLGFNDDKFNTVNVVVFNKVEKYNGLNEVRRVTGFLNSAYMFQSEDTKARVEATDVRNVPMFPSVNLLNRFDVVTVRDSKKLGYRTEDYRLIDAEEDDVFKVESYKDRLITLSDKNGRQRMYPVDRDVMVFTENQKVKGSNVQIHFSNGKVDIISIVPSDWKLGELENGVRVGTKSGYLVGYHEVNENVAQVEIRTAANLNAPVERYYVNRNAWKALVAKAGIGYAEMAERNLNDNSKDDVKLIFETSAEYHLDGIYFMYNIELAKKVEVDKDELEKEALKGAKLEVVTTETELTKDNKYYELKKSLVVTLVKADGTRTRLQENEFEVVGKAWNAQLEKGTNTYTIELKKDNTIVSEPFTVVVN